MIDRTYEDGLRDGRIENANKRAEDAHMRLDVHAKRLTAQERITYALLGAIALIELFPQIRAALGS